jgi:TonB family protein
MVIPPARGFYVTRKETFGPFGSPTMQQLAGTPLVHATPRERAPIGESLVVLTRDVTLAQIVKMLGSERAIVTVQAESDLAGELVSKQVGVIVIDAGAASSPLERLTEDLKSQFPDLILIVAGRLDDQSALAAQITAGTVYRFLHKPVSQQRVKLFIEAAWRRHEEQQSDPAAMLGVPKIPGARGTRLTYNSLWLGAAVLALLAMTGNWLMTRQPTPATPRAASPQLPAPGRDEQLEALLLRGDQAFATGALVAPPGANAADLYQQALSRNNTEPRAAAGLERVIDKLLSAAAAQLANQHLREAQKLIDQARAIKADPVRVAFLTAQITKERERFQARRAALLAAADPDPTTSTPATEHDITPTVDNSLPPAEIVNAAGLEIEHYLPPEFPPAARERGLSGWVDVQFLVKSDGDVSDVSVTGAEPPGIFEQAAVDALKRWSYKPVQHDGHAVDQRARLRMSFALDNP